MPSTPIERAESLFTDAVLILYSTCGYADFPEHFIRVGARQVMEERLHELRTADDPAYRFHRAQPVGSAQRSEDRQPSPEDSALQGLDLQSHGQLHALARKRIAEAVEILFEFDPLLAENHERGQLFMAACLRDLREQESPAERDALVGQVNRLRASIGMEPIDWERNRLASQE